MLTTGSCPPHTEVFGGVRQTAGGRKEKEKRKRKRVDSRFL